jgi:GTP-binding protein HflX
MIEISPPHERAVLIAAPRRGTADEQHAEDHLDELARLADTAGAEVVDRLTQRVNPPSPKLYIGSGKLEEVGQVARRQQATIVIFDEELSPAQGKNLEDALGVRVMDRAELILDIFATRARTNEAKMQVELAQLEYLLPRLARMWVHLSRIRGGIGLRGPGETQLETDRRMIRRKIGKLKGKLERVARHREVLRQGRRDVPTAALVGYTNAGKSSVLRALTGAEVFVEDRLFATLDTLTREAFVAPQERVRLIDTVGFIRKLPHHLVASFRATLEEVGFADALLHIIDASHPDWEEHVDVVDGVLGDLQSTDPRHPPAVDPRLPPSTDQRLFHVFNKMDLVDQPTGFSDRMQARYGEAACVAARDGEVAELKDWLTSFVGEWKARRSKRVS